MINTIFSMCWVPACWRCSLRKAATAAAALAGEAPLARPGTRAWRAASPRWCRSTNTTRRSSFAPTGRPTQVAAARRDGLHAPRGDVRRCVTEDRGTDRIPSSTASPICSSPPATACPSSSAASCAQHFKAGAFPSSPRPACTVTDLDGNRFYDLTGSYGVNVFGYDFYKECIARGSERVRDLGPVLGAYHPVTAYNVAPAAARSRAWTRCPSTCRAPRRSCRPCGWPATTRAAPTWCASAAPTTAGGATCSPASAIRSRHARPTR